MPNWYKKTESYVTGKREIFEDSINETIKKCIPVFDAITTGYILYTQVDIDVSEKDGMPYYHWPSQDAIDFHPIQQAPLHPSQNGYPYPKWNNPYAIITPPGYSVLCMPPLHRDSVFEILPGIVDTDTYITPINFPFILKDPNWTGIIPAGTPMAQIIPFKRQSFKMKMGNQKDVDKSLYNLIRLKTKIFNRYKTLFWQRKEYR